MRPLEKIKPLLLYTMTSGLGDYIVLGDLIEKIERLVPNAHCLIVHRGNPHVGLWPGIDHESKFFSIFSIKELLRLAHTVSSYRKAGYKVFGLQMAPGSIQGFLFYRLLKILGLVDYIVDFNLINADIITPPVGNYILDLHLNQVGELLQIEVPMQFYELQLPLKRFARTEVRKNESLHIGIHPWSRRGHLSSFVWPFEKWLEVVRHVLSEYKDCRITVLGRDKGFSDFEKYILENTGDEKERFTFSYSNSVNELIDTIGEIDVLLTVNTAVVHIGYALKKAMIILNGPSLDLWVPKGDNIFVVRDDKALFQASDKWEEDGSFGSVGRIDVQDVINVMNANIEL